MATQTDVSVVDDLDGSPNATTVSFAFEGQSWTIDLSKKNRAALEKMLKPYIEHATKQPRARARASSKRGTGAVRTDLAAIRSWANENGYNVSDHGRISTVVLDAYDASH